MTIKKIRHDRYMRRFIRWAAAHHPEVYGNRKMWEYLSLKEFRGEEFRNCPSRTGLHVGDWFWKLQTLHMRLQYHDYYRASGRCVCSVCKRIYLKHPELFDYSKEPPEFTGLWLLCDGDLVHL